ncbi:predicted protein [Nematostella vectensis]|uniref:Uncharacterized protein n=1 Tax=Nematostella vectensis TaxID=45351 RepID=A7S691_NEMVE|nr:predicted protein [Nematostella vectensis]|eukprot:XP_001632839.1 predicted protein [Nematostella vectensis]
MQRPYRRYTVDTLDIDFLPTKKKAMFRSVVVVAFLLCLAQTMAKPKVCPEGKPLVQCFVAPCQYASCPAYPNAECVNDYCGGCFARFYVNRKEVTKNCASII